MTLEQLGVLCDARDKLCGVCNAIECETCYVPRLIEKHEREVAKAVPMAQVEEVQKEIMQRIDEFIAEYKRISENSIDHFGGKADAMEVARRLVNAALTDLCSCGEQPDNA